MSKSWWRRKDSKEKLIVFYLLRFLHRIKAADKDSLNYFFTVQIQGATKNDK